MIVQMLAVVLVMGLCAWKAAAAETAKVLPKGISRVRAVEVKTDHINEKFDDSGKLASFTASLNRSVAVKDLAKKNDKLKSLANVLDKISPNLSQQLIGSNLYAEMDMRVETHLFAYERGITDNLTAGIRAPLVTRMVTARFRADPVQNGQAVANALGEVSPELRGFVFQAGSTSLNTEFFQEQLFSQYGYELNSFTRTEFGDVELGTKYKFFQNDKFLTTGLFGVRVPTGSSESLSNIVDKGSGRGNWGVGVQGFQEYYPTRFLTFGGAAKVSQPLPDTKSRAVPRSPDDTLPSLRPEAGQVFGVTRNQATEFESELSSTVGFFDNAFTVWGAWQYFAKGQDNYVGDKPGFSYSTLAVGSDVSRDNGEVGVGYSTIPAFRRKEFGVPLEVNLLYNTTLRGTNTPNVSYTRLDLMMYF